MCVPAGVMRRVVTVLIMGMAVSDPTAQLEALAGADRPQAAGSSSLTPINEISIAHYSNTVRRTADIRKARRVALRGSTARCLADGAGARPVDPIEERGPERQQIGGESSRYVR